jgi:hypothetical protein
VIPSPRNICKPETSPRRVQRRQSVLLRGMNSVKVPQC